jgi:hypothetical protein
MAHFAEIDNEGNVLRVLVVDDMYEHKGQEYLADEVGLGGTWIKTSYNTKAGQHLAGGTPLHKNYAGIGYKFDGIGFIPPQVYASWQLNEETYIWEPPTPMPVDDKLYVWNDENLTWEEYIPPTE